jgi:flavodoxin
MKTLVVCDSRAYGNTRKIAEAMASALSAEVVTPEEARRREIGAYDLVGFGSGIYLMDFYPELRQFVEALPNTDGKKAFLFLTSAASDQSMRKPVGKLTATLVERGYDVLGHFWCRGFWNPLLLRFIGGVNKGHPDQADLDSATTFAQRLAEARSRSAV